MSAWPVYKNPWSHEPELYLCIILLVINSIEFPLRRIWSQHPEWKHLHSSHLWTDSKLQTAKVSFTDVQKSFSCLSLVKWKAWISWYRVISEHPNHNLFVIPDGNTKILVRHGPRKMIHNDFQWLLDFQTFPGTNPSQKLSILWNSLWGFMVLRWWILMFLANPFNL